MCKAAYGSDLINKGMSFGQGQKKMCVNPECYVVKFMDKSMFTLPYILTNYTYTVHTYMHVYAILCIHTLLANKCLLILTTLSLRPYI